MTNTSELICQHCGKEYVRRACLDKHIKAKHTVPAPQAEQDGGEGYILQGPFFQRPDIDIPDIPLMDDSEDQELLALAAEAEPTSNCDKCTETAVKEKKIFIKIKALQNSQRLLRKLNRDKEVELMHCRKLLKEAVKDQTKKTMQLQTNTAPANL